MNRLEKIFICLSVTMLIFISAFNVALGSTQGHYLDSIPDEHSLVVVPPNVRGASNGFVSRNSQVTCLKTSFVDSLADKIAIVLRSVNLLESKVVAYEQLTSAQQNDIASLEQIIDNEEAKGAACEVTLGTVASNLSTVTDKLERQIRKRRRSRWIWMAIGATTTAVVFRIADK